MNLFCKHQKISENDILCTAHIHEGRCFICPYKSYNDSQNRLYPCVDIEGGIL
jgi:hypothetical protein